RQHLALPPRQRLTLRSTGSSPFGLAPVTLGVRGRCGTFHFRGGSSQHATHGTHQHQSSFGRHPCSRCAHGLRQHFGCLGQRRRQHQVPRVCYVQGVGLVASVGAAASVRAPPSNYSVKRTPVNRLRSSKRCGRRRLPQALDRTTRLVACSQVHAIVGL